jgi:S-DNA-T family DNA segregation ATPase FtsK/SpoIIIE
MTAALVRPSAPVRIAAPTLPVAPEKQPFPLVASLAPVVMSVVIWLVTQSAYALLFAALGPAVAIASVVDARRTGRRRLRREMQRFERDVQSVRTEIDEAHQRERAVREQVTPSGGARALSGDVVWGLPAEAALCLGVGDRASEVTLDGLGSPRSDEPPAVSLRALREHVAVLDRAPIGVATTTIGIAGPAHARRALARSLVVQLAAQLSPAGYCIATAEPEEWMRELPHRLETSATDAVEFRSLGEEPNFTVVTAAHPGGLPRVGATVTLSGASALYAGEAFAPDYLSHPLAAAWARSASAIAVRDHLVPPRALLPDSVAFAELAAAAPADGDDRLGLDVVIGLGEGGSASIDLVGDGPHAVVGGMTGSGKSELLVTWLLAMAARFSPRQVNFLLFDFKGGAAFSDVAALPHTVGLVTDLDQSGAARALASLAAELRYRERLLARHGARSSTDLDDESRPPRLVVVVDEFAALATDFPDLHAAFTDLAARGRSLGLHLILCTQRPAGVVRDAVLANSGLRISLRVNNRADSVAVVSSDAAARLAGTPPGRAVVTRSGGEPQLVQVAIATRADLVVAQQANGYRPRRPWLDPLPRALALSAVPASDDGIAFGLTDLPAEQAQPPAVWNPAVDGALLVLGAAGSGKSTALRALGPARWVPNDVEGAWDALVEPEPVGLTVIDDLDTLLRRFDDDYQRPVIELVSRLVRGNAPLAVSAGRLGPQLQQLAALCESRLLLRMPNRQEHLLAGGSTAAFDPDLPPGAGFWRGVRAQVGLTPADAATRPARPTSLPFAPLGPVLAICSRPSALVARLAARQLQAVELDPPGSCDPLTLAVGIRVLVADADTWQAHWAALGTLRSRYPLLFAGSSPAEFRAISRARIVPPPIANSSTTCWLLSPEGVARRVTI